MGSAMKVLKPLLFLAALWIGAALSPASAACGGGASNCFLIATGNWNSGLTWSATSGGGSCNGTTCATGPAATDSVVLDTLSNGFTATISATASIANVTQTCTTCVLAHAGVVLTVSGNTFTIGYSGGYSVTSANAGITFTSTSGTTNITLAGNQARNVVLNGVGGNFVFLDTGTITVGSGSAALTLTNGTADFTTNNPNVTLLCGFSSNNTNTRTLKMGTGTWTVQATAAGTTGGCTGAGWDAGTTTASFTPFTCTCGSAALNFTTTTTAASRVFNANQQSYGDVTIHPLPSNSTSSITFAIATTASTTGTTFKSLTISPPSLGGGAAVVTFTAPATFNFTTAPAWTGYSPGAILYLTSVSFLTSGNAVTFSTAGAATIDTAILSGTLVFGGAGTWTATNTMAAGGVTGLTSLTAPTFGTGGGGGHIIGG